MVFDEIEDVEYTKYDKNTKKTTLRHIDINIDIAEELNKIIAVYNKENKQLKLNSSICGNIALKYWIKSLNDMSTDEILNMLTHENLKINGLI